MKLSMNPGKCRHFNGLQNHKCEKGVEYDSFAPRQPLRVELPCLRYHHSSLKPNAIPEKLWNGKKECQFFSEPTEEELNEQKVEIKLCIQKMIVVRRSIVEYTKGKRGAAGSIDCPSCKTGKVSYSVSSYNGHIWAQCTTPGCVNWIE